MTTTNIELFETGLDGAEVSRRYKNAVRSMQKNEVTAAFYLAEVDRRRLWHGFGYSSVIHFAVSTGDIGENKAYGLLRIGKGLVHYPLLRKAFTDGSISWTKVRTLFRLKESFDERNMLEKAMQMTNRNLEQFVTRCNKSFRRKKAGQGAESGNPPTASAIDAMQPNGRLLPEGEDFSLSTVSSAPPAGNLIPDGKAARYSDDDKGQFREARMYSFGGASEFSNAIPQYNPTLSGAKNRQKERSDQELVSVTLKLTPEEYTTVKEAHRIWKRKNRHEWKRERMIVSLSRLFLEETAVSGHLDRNPGLSQDKTGQNERNTGLAQDKTDQNERNTGLPQDKTGQNERNTGLAGIKTGYSDNNSKTSGGNGAAETATDEKELDVSPIMIDSPYSIVIQHCPECGRNLVAGKRGDMLEVEESLLEQARCDGAVHKADDNGMPGRKKRSISPALRKKIFVRDRGVCRTPGCGSASFLEIHHVKPISQGGVSVTLGAPSSPGFPEPESIVLSPRSP